MAGWMNSFSNDWGSMFGSAMGGQGGSSLMGDFDWGSAISGLFGGGGSSGGSSSGDYGDIFKAILGGVGGYATAKMDEKSLKEAGKQQRKTLSFQAQLGDFYNQKDKVRKRAALDTYGQFSLLDRYAPNRTAARPIDAPPMPSID